jgi:hypothetical protein
VSAPAVAAIRLRSQRSRRRAAARWAAVTEDPIPDHLNGGRLTVNFHPDRRDRTGRTVAAALCEDGRYLSQWHTGISNGSRSAMSGGARERFELNLFGAPVDAVYGTWDLLLDPHGGSPFFGSCFLILAPHMQRQTTLCIGDSCLDPEDVGTFDAPWSILASLAEQAERSDLLGRPLGLDVLCAALAADWIPLAPGRVLDRYVEAQIHGAIDLASDATGIVADPSFLDTAVERDMVAIAERYGLQMSWHRGSVLDTNDGALDARSIGELVDGAPFERPRLEGEPDGHIRQVVKRLWQRTLRDGRDLLS